MPENPQNILKTCEFQKCVVRHLFSWRKPRLILLESINTVTIGGTGLLAARVLRYSLYYELEFIVERIQLFG